MPSTAQTTSTTTAWPIAMVGREPAAVRRCPTCENGSVHAKSPGRALRGIYSATFSDPTNERLIYLSAAGLILIGLALLIGTIIWWHRGRQEHPVLAPLEVMSTRSWANATEGDRRRRLDSVRVNGVEPQADQVVRPDPVDLQALVRSTPQAFDDLREPGEAAAVEPPAEAAAEDSEEPPHVYEVNASGDAELVADDERPEEVDEPAVVESVVEGDEPAVVESPDQADEMDEPAVEESPAESPAEVDVDATMFATERSAEPVESLSAVPTEPSR